MVSVTICSDFNVQKNKACQCFHCFPIYLPGSDGTRCDEIGRASCRERVKTVRDFIFLGSKITTDGDCSHEMKRHLLLGRKVMTNLDSIFKSRYITLSTKVHLVKALVFPVIMYGCESCTVKKAEHKRIDAFGLWCWRRLLKVGLQGGPTSPS